jgi:pilus assembly protein Flp/PilA
MHRRSRQILGRARKGGEFNMLEILMTYFRPFMKREEGQGLVEYALILSLVSIACIGALTALAGGINGVFTTVTSAL